MKHKTDKIFDPKIARSTPDLAFQPYSFIQPQTNQPSNLTHRTLGDILSERCHCYTLEVSFSSYRLPNVPNAIPYTPESCWLSVCLFVWLCVCVVLCIYVFV